MKNSILSIRPLGFPWETEDPFLFCAYHRDDYPAGAENMGPSKEALNGRNIGQDFTIKDGWRMYHGSTIPGFPYHPHRGFETITINNEGVVDHSDSLGASGRFMGGDVQWMTAGKGVQHSEMFPLIHKDRANTLEIFQIWLNLPKANKMVEPHFKMLWKEEIPTHIYRDENGLESETRVIAGQFYDVKALHPTPNSWAANADNAVNVLTVKLDQGATWVLPATIEGSTRNIYYYRGNQVRIEDQVVDSSSRLVLNPDNDVKIANQDSPSYLLVLEGRPINEPVVKYGPFVMNTEAEIQEAFSDYRETQFGGWPWSEREVTHGDRGRFALYADGTIETRDV